MTVFVGMLVNAVMNWFAKFFADHIAAYERDKANQAAQANQSAQDSKKANELNPDSTEKQVDEAIDDELNHL